MLLSILMPALNDRQWQRMASWIKVQTSRFDDVEFLTEVDGGERTSGQKRQSLMEQASGEYLCFVDDDDDVRADYVDLIREGCLQGVDVVTHCLEFTRKDKPNHSEIWKFGLWMNDRRRGQMQVNHLCAWKESIARMVAWCPLLGNYDDHLWFEPLLPFVKTEHHIPEVLYHYQYDPRVSRNQSHQRRQFAKGYFGPGLRCFLDEQNAVWIESDHTKRTKDGVLVRDDWNRESFKALDGLYHYHTVRFH